MPLNFLDDKGPGAHPGAGEAGAPAGEKKKEDHRQQIIVIATILGVIVAYLTYRSVRGGTAAASSTGVPLTSASVPGTTSGTVADSGVGSTDAINGFNSYLDNISGELTSLNGNLLNTQANPTQATAANTAQPLNWNVPYVTGDVSQDNAIANSTLVAGAHQAYAASGFSSAPLQQQYDTDVNQYYAANPVKQPSATTT